MAFKIGDKVVFIGGGKFVSEMNCPKINTEVVEIVGESPLYKGSYYLGGYETRPLDGLKQSFNGSHLRKVEPNKATNSVTKALIKEFKESEKHIEYDPKEIKIPVTN